MSTTPPPPGQMPEPDPMPPSGQMPNPGQMPQAGMMPTPTPMPLQPTKKVLSMTALGLTILASLMILASSWLALRGMTPEAVSQMGMTELVEAAENADAIRFGTLGIAGLINLVALIVAIVAVVKERPKTMSIIALVTVLVLPGIATFISGRMMQSALETLMAGLSL